MRISADTCNSAFSPLAAYASVWIDGQQVENCILADDELGEVICLKFDTTNKLVLNEFGEPILTVHLGAVEIRIEQ